MASGDRRIGFIFGILGAALFVLSGLLSLVGGLVVFALGHPARGLGDWDHAAILVAVGLITGLFALVGRARGRDDGLLAGVVLIVIALLGWLALGFGSGVLSILGVVCVLIGGVVYLLSQR